MERSERDLLELARRLRAAIERELEERRREEERRERLLQRREALLERLEAFGREVGHFELERSPAGGLRLGFRGRWLAFEPSGPEGALAVEGEGLPRGSRIEWEERLGRWTWSWDAPASRDHRKLLFCEGLEELLARALGVRPLPPEELPPPGAGEPESPTPRRSL